MQVPARRGGMGAAALMVFGSIVVAQPSVETFEGYNSITPTAGISSMPSTIASPLWATQFGPPNVALISNATTDFPYASPNHSKYLSWKENTSQFVRLNWGAGSLPGTSTVHQIAFAIRIALDPTTINNDIDIVSVYSGSPSSIQWGLVADGATRQLRMADVNGWGTFNVIGNRAFDPTWPLNWGDGQWRVIIGQVAAGPNFTGAAKWWVMTPATGATIQLLDTAGPSNTRPVGAINSVGFGASMFAAGSSNICQVDIDQFSVFPTNLYPTEAQFLAGVRATMSGAGPPSFAVDSDNDGLSDAYELLRGSNPNHFASRPTPTLGDIDGDGDVDDADIAALATALVNRTSLSVDRAGIVDDNVAGNIADDTIFNAADLTQLANWRSGVVAILR